MSTKQFTKNLEIIKEKILVKHNKNDQMRLFKLLEWRDEPSPSDEEVRDVVYPQTRRERKIKTPDTPQLPQDEPTKTKLPDRTITPQDKDRNYEMLGKEIQKFIPKQEATSFIKSSFNQEQKMLLDTIIMSLLSGSQKHKIKNLITQKAKQYDFLKTITAGGSVRLFKDEDDSFSMFSEDIKNSFNMPPKSVSVALTFHFAGEDAKIETQKLFTYTSTRFTRINGTKYYVDLVAEVEFPRNKNVSFFLTIKNEKEQTLIPNNVATRLKEFFDWCILEMLNAWRNEQEKQQVVW